MKKPCDLAPLKIIPYSPSFTPMFSPPPFILSSAGLPDSTPSGPFFRLSSPPLSPWSIPLPLSPPLSPCSIPIPSSPPLSPSSIPLPASPLFTPCSVPLPDSPTLPNKKRPKIPYRKTVECSPCGRAYVVYSRLGFEWWSPCGHEIKETELVGNAGLEGIEAVAEKIADSWKTATEAANKEIVKIVEPETETVEDIVVEAEKTHNMCDEIVKEIAETANVNKHTIETGETEKESVTEIIRETAKTHHMCDKIMGDMCDEVMKEVMKALDEWDDWQGQ